MPIEIKAYKCIHKCRKTSTRYGSMDKHEKVCLRNPALKTCKTCANDERYDDGPGNYCHAEVEKGEKNLMHYCEKWKSK